MEDANYGDGGELEGCGKFYLPAPATLKVVGYAEDTPYPCDRLVVMIHEDGTVYGYDGDELHRVAPSFDELKRNGLNHLALASYYYGEAFKDTTAEDWAKARESPRAKKAEDERSKMLASHKGKVADLIVKSKAKRRRLRDKSHTL